MIENVVLNLKYVNQYDCQMGTGTCSIPVTIGHYYLITTGGGDSYQVPIKSDSCRIISVHNKTISNFCSNYSGNVAASSWVVQATSDTIQFTKNQYVSIGILLFEFQEW